MNNVYLELFGYLCTALVLISMIMTSVVKLLLQFLESCQGDIDTYFPGYQYVPGESRQVRMVYDGMEAVGVLIGTSEGDTFRAELDYVTRKYRDCSIAAFLLDCLKKAGFAAVEEPQVSQAHNQYLAKMGFA